MNFESENKLNIIDEDQIIEILKTLDQDGNGQVEFSEFMALSLSRQHLSEQNLKVLFDDIMSSALMLKEQKEIGKKLREKLKQKFVVKNQEPGDENEGDDIQEEQNDDDDGLSEEFVETFNSEAL